MHVPKSGKLEHSAPKVDVGGDEDEASPIEEVAVCGSSILLRSVQVDWAECKLVDSSAVLAAIEKEQTESLVIRS